MVNLSSHASMPSFQSTRIYRLQSSVAQVLIAILLIIPHYVLFRILVMKRRTDILILVVLVSTSLIVFALLLVLTSFLSLKNQVENFSDLKASVTNLKHRISFLL